MKNIIMILSFTLVIVISLSFNNCGKKENDVKTDKTSITTAMEKETDIINETNVNKANNTETNDIKVKYTIDSNVEDSEKEDEFKLTSTAFKEGEMIPKVYTCDNPDKIGISPPLSWENAPSDTKSFAIICIDPDAMDFAHWIIFNIPPTEKGLAENVPRKDKIDNGTKQGANSWCEGGPCQEPYGAFYGGPCPPSGIHKYIFTIYALDSMLDLQEGVKTDMTKFLDATAEHSLEVANLTGKYGK